MEVSVGLAAAAGVVSFLSPCVLALVPAYIGYLGGRTLVGGDAGQQGRWASISHGLAFVLGFSLIFVALGAAASKVGALLYDVRYWLARIGGLIVILFGLHTTGLITIPFLDYDIRRQRPPDPTLGYLSSFLMGVFFSAGWAPCVGPVLGAVLTMALSSAQLGQGVLLLSAYSAGMAVPFLLAAAGIGQAAGVLKRHGRAIQLISIAAGVVMVAIGAMLLTGTLGRISQYGAFFDLGL